jgi:phosphoribosylaminoimidazolecarboxamide formyltransferase/IMP cyclohydrolase
MGAIRRALLSVSDKTGLVEFAEELAGLGVELVSTGGTAKTLQQAGLKVIDISDWTGFPEIMDGRVKTLHPKVHGGLLAIRDNADHQSAMQQHDIGPIDLLAVNLYPFEDTLASGGSYEELVENIDIGGPAMTRAAAKNHGDVTTIVDPADYLSVVDEMREHSGATTQPTRSRLAAKAFARTAAYDSIVSTWLLGQTGEGLGAHRALGGSLIQPLRYGENPHQSAAFYRTGEKREGVATARQLQGKELSYNNINDTDAAFECVSEFDPVNGAACVIVKHANPCGVATAPTALQAYELALRCDPVSAFGGIVAFNQPIDEATAKAVCEVFTEVIIAPGLSSEAEAIFAGKKNLRILTTNALADPVQGGLAFKTVSGGFLVQSRDNGRIQLADLKIVTKRKPSDAELADLLFAFRVAKHVKSNAIIYAKDGATVGVGAGQMSRIDSSRVAAHKARDAADAAGIAETLTTASVVASDAFFPFADGLLQAASAGATAIIQPGGSMRDDEVIAAADEKNLAMVFTGMRHFRH